MAPLPPGEAARVVWLRRREAKTRPITEVDRPRKRKRKKVESRIEYHDRKLVHHTL